MSTGSLQQILQAYQAKYKENIYLLKGGTLRYAKEICSVIIVCAQHHRGSEGLCKYNPVSPRETKPISMNGLTDRNGKVSNYLAVPMYHSEYISKSDGWGSLAMAFYFNNEFRVKDLKHDKIS